MSALAVACSCLWNGCFNSIQVICRERGVIKREHRSGMHISAYIVGHMLYQALLCMLQAAISLYVFRFVGVSFPAQGVVFSSIYVEFFISMFIITYAADMMALWISAFSHTTTAAMTIMPVVLIFQLVFSGGMMTLPKRFQPIQNFTISNWGLKLITAQADYNSQPLSTPWKTLWGMRDAELNTSFTLGQALDFLEESDNKTVQEVLNAELVKGLYPVGSITVGDVMKMLREDGDEQNMRKQTINIHITLGELMNLIGTDKIRDYVQETTSAAAYNEEYAYTPGNIAEYWVTLMLFSFVFACLAIVTLEFIDHDRR